MVLDLTRPAEVEVSMRAAVQRAREDRKKGIAADFRLENSVYCAARQPEPADYVPEKGLTPPHPSGKLLKA
jgi:hypothetical protein